MINNSSSSYHIDPDNTPNVVLEIKNLGFGPAINLNTYLRKLVSVDGLNHLDESLTKKVEDFYDKIHLGNYVYYDYEDETELNEDWQIFPTFNLGVSEGNNYIYLAFSFVNINEPIYSIIEFNYENILGKRFKQYFRLYYDGHLLFLPISKVYPL